jgi:hypothetical protein
MATHVKRDQHAAPCAGVLANTIAEQAPIRHLLSGVNHQGMGTDQSCVDEFALQ